MIIIIVIICRNQLHHRHLHGVILKKPHDKISPLYDDFLHHDDKVWNDGHDIRIFGHGTLSGDFIPHPNYADPPVRFRSVNAIFLTLS